MPDGGDGGSVSAGTEFAGAVAAMLGSLGGRRNSRGSAPAGRDDTGGTGDRPEVTECGGSPAEEGPTEEGPAEGTRPLEEAVSSDGAE